MASIPKQNKAPPLHRTHIPGTVQTIQNRGKAVNLTSKLPRSQSNEASRICQNIFFYPVGSYSFVLWNPASTASSVSVIDCSFHGIQTLALFKHNLVQTAQQKPKRLSVSVHPWPTLITPYSPESTLYLSPLCPQLEKRTTKQGDIWVMVQVALLSKGIMQP